MDTKQSQHEEVYSEVNTAPRAAGKGVPRSGGQNQDLRDLSGTPQSQSLSADQLATAAEHLNAALIALEACGNLHQVAHDFTSQAFDSRDHELAHRWLLVMAEASNVTCRLGHVAELLRQRGVVDEFDASDYERPQVSRRVDDAAAQPPPDGNVGGAAGGVL